jgi:hypothetical protein
MTDLGPVHWHLGMRISRNDGVSGSISIDQESYVRSILQEFKMDQCKPVSTPGQSGSKLTKSMCPTTEEEKQQMSSIPYRTVIGKLIYLAGCTRPDIAEAVGAVSRFMSNPAPNIGPLSNESFDIYKERRMSALPSTVLINLS